MKKMKILAEVIDLSEEENSICILQNVSAIDNKQRKLAGYITKVSSSSFGLRKKQKKRKSAFAEIIEIVDEENQTENDWYWEHYFDMTCRSINNKYTQQSIKKYLI